MDLDLQPGLGLVPDTGGLWQLFTPVILTGSASSNLHQCFPLPTRLELLSRVEGIPYTEQAGAKGATEPSLLDPLCKLCALTS